MAPIDLTVPKLLPISGTWAAPFALYSLILSGRIVRQRTKHKVFIGDTLPSTNASPTKPADNPTPDPLQVAVRCQANFLDTVPLAFVFLVIAELNGGNRKALNYAMGALFALRIAHADAGLRLQGKFGDNGIGRLLGYFGSMGVLGGLAGYTGWLIREYWGF